MVQLASLWLLSSPLKEGGLMILLGTVLVMSHPLNYALFGRREAGKSQNRVREDVDNHGTGVESCFIYWYRCSHSAWRYLL